jgi:hypothetical protein
MVPWWAGSLASLGIVGVGSGAVTGVALITFFGFLCMLIGFVPIGRKLFTLSVE